MEIGQGVLLREAARVKTVAGIPAKVSKRRPSPRCCLSCALALWRSSVLGKLLPVVEVPWRFFLLQKGLLAPNSGTPVCVG